MKVVPFKRRWYDQHPLFAQSVQLLEQFPPEIQSIVAEGVIFLTNREFQAHERIKSLKSLGPEKVLGLYKSKNKRREGDENPLVHRALNHLYILSDENRVVMAREILQLFQYIYEYIRSCEAVANQPIPDDVSEVTRLFLERGQDEVRHFLNKVQQEFQRKLREAAVPALSANMEIQESDRSMKIRDRGLHPDAPFQTPPGRPSSPPPA